MGAPRLADVWVDPAHGSDDSEWDSGEFVHIATMQGMMMGV
jgi:hypothetical protein